VEKTNVVFVNLFKLVGIILNMLILISFSGWFVLSFLLSTRLCDLRESAFAHLDDDAMDAAFESGMI
jgi:hypothetical protein